MKLYFWWYGKNFYHFETAEEAVELVERKFKPYSLWGEPGTFVGLYESVEGNPRAHEEGKNKIDMPWTSWPEDLNEVRTFLESQNAPTDDSLLNPPGIGQRYRY